VSARGWRLGRPALATAILALAATRVAAQELEPQAYSPNPSGMDFLLVGFGRTTGSVVFDPSLPIKDVRARINGTTLLYGHTFGLWGRSASAGLGLPYVWGTVAGEVQEERREIRRSGLADMRARLAVNLLGGPAMALPEFVRRRPRTTLGASLVVAAPSGQYDPAKLVNIGANRWSLKPEIGVAHPTGRWTLETYLGAWFFTDNRQYYGGQEREQSPLGTVQAHVSYTFKPRLWLAGDATFYTGGRTTVGGKVNADLQKNSRLGLTLAVPIGRNHSVKASWATGVSTRIGADFDTLSVGYQYLRF
jgi:Putative MetA-pathway of phenol degradation